MGYLTHGTEAGGKTYDLLFCPFCGGEAHIKEVVSACSVVYTVGCSDSECMGFETLLCKTTPEEAIAAWNRRAERTCRVEASYEIWDDGTFEYELSCGHTVGWPCNCPPDFCPYCGAKVIGGTMPTDDERREVAARLRDANHHSCSPDCELRYALDDCYDCIGNGCAGCHRDAFDRLADLIDPDVSPTRHRHVGGKKTSQTPSQCDRDALLAMAEEMVEMFRIGAFTGEGIDKSWCRELYDKYARRIREALGVEP